VRRKPPGEPNGPLVEQAGLLRAVVLFHEAELLGAGQSILNAVEPLGEYGWSVSGWIPGPGRLSEAASEVLASTVVAQRPLAVSLRGFREHPGALARVRATPSYLASVRSALLRLRPHVVHANTLRSLPEAWVARSLGLPVVIHVHELPPESAKRTAALRVAGRIADVVVTVSDAVASIARPYAGHRLLTVRNGVPLSPATTAAGDRPFTVGTAGIVSRLKGTDVFLRAAALVAEQRPEVRFEQAGQADQHRDRGLDEELAGLLATPSLRTSAAMLGRANVSDLLSRWDLYVHPSRMDAFPLATLEAMAAGVPVIASNVGGVPEQIDHLEHGVLVAAGDPLPLADWIVRLHDDRELRMRLAQHALRRVRDEFSVARQACGLHAAYLSALNRRFAPAAIRASAA
jgi:glycosyltransferase involved in cell wall biosynthesis